MCSHAHLFHYQGDDQGRGTGNSALFIRLNKMRSLLGSGQELSCLHWIALEYDLLFQVILVRVMNYDPRVYAYIPHRCICNVWL